MHFLARVEIRYKKSVLEPQGEAIRLALKDKFTDQAYAAGFGLTAEELQHSIDSIRAGKLIELKLNASSKEQAQTIIDKITLDLLHNPVMETAQVYLEELK